MSLCFTKIKLLNHIHQKFKAREKAEMDIAFGPLLCATFNLNTVFGDVLIFSSFGLRLRRGRSKHYSLKFGDRHISVRKTWI